MESVTAPGIAFTMFGWWGFNLWLPGYLSLPVTEGGVGLSQFFVQLHSLAGQLDILLREAANLRRNASDLALRLGQLKLHVEHPLLLVNHADLVHRLLGRRQPPLGQSPTQGEQLDPRLVTGDLLFRSRHLRLSRLPLREQ